jgi:site-specific recombinase XerD
MLRPPVKPRNASVRPREYLTKEEIQILRDTAKTVGRHGQRDWLLILMMYRHALRCGEIILLQWDQVDLNSEQLHVNRLKNGDSSIHYLEGEELRWLKQLQRMYPTSKFVFFSERGGPLSERQVHYIIARAGKHAGFEFPVHPHMLRHAKGFQLAAKGIDTRAIQAYFGHKNIQHTAQYSQLDPTCFKGFGKE